VLGIFACLQKKNDIYIQILLQLEPIHNWLICPMSVSGEKFYPQNTPCISRHGGIKIFAFLEREQIQTVMDRHQFSERSTAGRDRGKA